VIGLDLRGLFRADRAGGIIRPSGVVVVSLRAKSSLTERSREVSRPHNLSPKAARCDIHEKAQIERARSNGGRSTHDAARGFDAAGGSADGLRPV
jgi:hypothetical protein